MGTANRGRSIIIHNKVGYMAGELRFRGGRRETVWPTAILAFVAVFALLVARIDPPEFSKAPSLHHSSVSAFSNHNNHRPRFDNGGLQWSAPARSFLHLPPAAVGAQFTTTSQLFSTLQTKGFHYNRPPPAS